MQTETKQTNGSNGKTGNERCEGCGAFLFKLHIARGCVFLEIKCRHCERTIIKKFHSYEKIGGDNG